MGKDGLRRAVERELPVGHDKETVGVNALVHVVCDEHDRNARRGAKIGDRAQHIPPPGGIEHGGGLVQNKDFRLHREHARDSDALLLSAGEKVRGVMAEFIHTDALERLVHAAADLRRGNAQIFGSERHIILHDARDDLVIGVLKHHADRPAHVEEIFLIARVHALDGNRSLRRHKNGVQELRKRGFSRAVVAEHGDE